MTGALIIATGKTDHQSAFAPERQIGRISALERMVLLLQMTGIRRIAVVGDEREYPKKLVPSMNLVFLTASSEGEMSLLFAGSMYRNSGCSWKCTHVFGKNGSDAFGCRRRGLYS